MWSAISSDRAPYGPTYHEAATLGQEQPTSATPFKSEFDKCERLQQFISRGSNHHEGLHATTRDNAARYSFVATKT